MKSILKTIGAAVQGGTIVLDRTRSHWETSQNPVNKYYSKDPYSQPQPVNYEGNTAIAESTLQKRQKTVHAVVHVKNLTVLEVILEEIWCMD
jgi:hypothetical protein